jgi:hypothetical protein
MKALAIGVGAAPRLAYLAGALNGARSFHEWAGALGYQSTLLTDDDAPVTIVRLRQELTTLLAAGPCDRLLLYFAGHGLIREMEEGLWLLSDWDAELRAVEVEGLKRRLFQYGIRQLGIFADACRSLPADVQAADLTPDRVLGRGPLAVTMPDVDKFIATQDGAATFAIQGENPEDDRCLFSGVLLEGLWGALPDAYSTLPTFTDRVTSRSLGKFLKAEVPKRATFYGLSITPTVSPTFADGEDVYFQQVYTAKAPKLPAWPASLSPKKGQGPAAPSSPGAMPPPARSAPPVFAVPGHIPAETAGDSPPAAPPSPSPSPAPAVPAAPAIDQELREQHRPGHFETRAGFAVDGEPVAAVWTLPGIFAERHGAPNWWRVGQHQGFQLQHPTPVLIEYANGNFGAVTALPGFIGSMLVRSRGAAAMIYRSMDAAFEPTTTAEKAFRYLEKGSLRADDVADLAIALRQGKHADPVLGVISAYLYASIGDIDSIRAMAYYYIGYGQPIPYDIALLGQLPGLADPAGFRTIVPAVKARRPRTDQEERFRWTHAATPEARGTIAGLWPWMRQGWTFLDDDPSDQGSALILPGLLDLREHLTSARFATLNAAGGKKLAASLHQFGPLTPNL